MIEMPGEHAPDTAPLAGSAERTESVRRQFEDEGLAWDSTWEFVARRHPDFAEACAGMRRVPRRKAQLSPRLASLVELTVNAAATHLNVKEIGPALRRTLGAGAQPSEILECLELAATVGIHAMNIGVPLLVEVLEEEGRRTGPEPLGPHQKSLQERFTRERGYWHEFWDEMLELDPEMFEAYIEFSAVPWRSGTLSSAEKELIYISYDVAATHLYVPGTKLHIRNALNHGATVGQVLEVMEIASMIGIQGLTTTVPLLRELLADDTTPDPSAQDGSEHAP